MGKNKKKKQQDSERSVVFSTNPETLGDLFKDLKVGEDFTAPQDSRIRVVLEKKGRAGKIVSLITGFNRPEDELNDLLKEIKSNCGTGGSMQDDSTLLIQGDNRDKIIALLKSKGYKDVKKSGG